MLPKNRWTLGVATDKNGDEDEDGAGSHGYGGGSRVGDGGGRMGGGVLLFQHLLVLACHAAVAFSG